MSEQQEVIAEWGGEIYRATVNEYGVATVRAGTKPVESNPEAAVQHG